MKSICDSAPRLLRLLLLAELLVYSSCRPAHSALCGKLALMVPQVESLLSSSKNLSDDELPNVATTNTKLHGLPHVKHTAENFSSLKVNESLSQLYVHVQSFQLHVDWLKTAKDNFSLPSQAAEGASSHLLHLSKLIKASLNQMGEEDPQPQPPPSLPVPSTAFDVLQFSVEISERLTAFCHWSKRILRQLQRLSHCPRR